MRRLIFGILAAGLLVLTGCDDDDNNNNNNGFRFGPNSCFASGANVQYQWLNGQCIDRRNNTPVSPQFCGNSAIGNNFDPQCNAYGGFPVLPGQPGFGFGANAFDRCSQAYGPGWVTTRGVFGELVCVNAATWSHVTSFGNPMLFNGLYQACRPGFGPANCNCNNIGGTLGWVAGGASVGYCF